MKLLLISHENTSWDITHLPLNKWYQIDSMAESEDKSIFISIELSNGSIGWIPRKNFLDKNELRESNLSELLK